MEQQKQLTLGELIKALEPMLEDWKGKVASSKEKNDEEPTIIFDFGSALPTGLSSYRGYYAQLAINYSFNGYGNMVGYHKQDGSTFEPKPPTLSEFLAMLKEADGKEYIGWKGGEFVMRKNTPLWVANDGDCDDTAVVGVFNKGWGVILLTQFHE
jgi:hypothetical protein